MLRRTWYYRQAELGSSKDFGPNVAGETRPNRFRPNLNAGLGAFLDKSGEARKGAFWMEDGNAFFKRGHPSWRTGSVPFAVELGC